MSKINIGNTEVPKPLEVLGKEEMYYYVDLANLQLYGHDCNYFYGEDKYRLSAGLVHATKENAIAHAEALLAVVKGE